MQLHNHRIIISLEFLTPTKTQTLPISVQLYGKPPQDTLELKQKHCRSRPGGHTRDGKWAKDWTTFSVFRDAHHDFSASIEKEWEKAFGWRRFCTQTLSADLDYGWCGWPVRCSAVFIIGGTIGMFCFEFAELRSLFRQKCFS